MPIVCEILVSRSIHRRLHRCSNSWLRAINGFSPCNGETNFIFVPRWRPARDPDATAPSPSMSCCPSAAADTRKSEAAACDCRRGCFDNARTVSNIAYVSDTANGPPRTRLARASVRAVRTPRSDRYIISFLCSNHTIMRRVTCTDGPH